MWTPKRLLLLVAGFALFFSGYQVYVHFLGRYDGLPPLPEEHKPGRSAGALPPRQVQPPENPAVALLRKHFPGGDEVDRDIRFYWQPQGIVLAADDGQLVDGKLQLTKVSVALLGKAKADGRELEVNTIRGQTALIEFDQPIKNLKDASDRRPVGGTLEGNVHLQNNRRTGRMDDDLHLDTEWLAFSESEHRVWTDRPVILTDSHPFQRRITGTGLEVILLPADEKPGQRKERHKPSVGGVKQIRLEREVRMDLLVEADGFMSTGAAPVSASGGEGAAKSPVAVTSRGPFLYEVECEQETDRATFTDKVNVIRKLEIDAAAAAKTGRPIGDQYDQLDCDKLVLLFRRKGGDDKIEKRKPDEERTDLKLLSARATGPLVVLVSDAEHLHATGNDFLYEAETKRSILKGDPDMIAERDGHQMRARALVIEGVGEKDPKQKSMREAVAIGPGEILMKMHDRPNEPGLVARWQDELRSSKEGEVDKLVLTGQVFLEDPQRGRLQADRMTVWLETVEFKEDGVAKRRPLPRRMEAHGRVRTVSPELRILHADSLHMQFEDAHRPGPKGAAGENAAARPGDVLNKPEAAPADPKKSRRPIELRARSVDVRILRDGNKNELKELHTQGEVHVAQKPQTPDDQAVEIKGERLDLHSFPAGHVLQVSGRPAFVQLDKLFITGPVVNINQPENNAWVTGMGSLRMPSRTNFEGKKLDKPADLTVHWKDRMAFDGIVAEFHGGVQASQSTGRLVCQMLQVVLDRPVSLKEGKEKKGEPSPAMHRLLCSERVRFEDGVMEGQKWRVFRRVEGNELSFNNPDGILGVSGPGTVYLLQPGSKEGGLLESPAVAPQVRPRTAEEQEMKLTRIHFEGTMMGNKNKGIVTFLDRVEVFHLPADDPDVLIDENNPPPKTMWLKCRKLEVLQQKLDGDRATHEFKASGQVNLKLQEFEAVADEVHFNEEKDQLVLLGNGPNKVTIFRKRQRGADPEPYRGRKFIYNRKTGQLNGDKVDMIRPNP